MEYMLKNGSKVNRKALEWLVAKTISERKIDVRTLEWFFPNRPFEANIKARAYRLAKELEIIE